MAGNSVNLAKSRIFIEVFKGILCKIFF